MQRLAAAALLSCGEPGVARDALKAKEVLPCAAEDARSRALATALRLLAEAQMYYCAVHVKYGAVSCVTVHIDYGAMSCSKRAA